MRQKLNQMELLIENWHTLMPLKEQDRSVVKRRGKRRGIYPASAGQLSTCRNMVVINDEAHHAYRKPAELKISEKRRGNVGAGFGGSDAMD